jgi:hypothetical protein
MHKQQLFIQNSSTNLATNFYLIFLGTNEKNFVVKRNKEHNPKAGERKVAHTTPKGTNQQENLFRVYGFRV